MSINGAYGVTCLVAVDCLCGQRRVQSTHWEQRRFETGQELQQLSTVSFREHNGRPLDAVLSDQHETAFLLCILVTVEIYHFGHFNLKK